MAKLVWRVKLVAELQPGVATEAEVARIERDEEAGLADLGLRLEEAKQLTAALQAEIVPAQVAVLSECHRSCVACGCTLASKGHYRVRFRSLFGEVPLRVRRLLICSCQGGSGAKSAAGACKPVGFITRLLRLSLRHWRDGSRDNACGRRPRACRPARRCERRGRAAPSSCSSASAASCSCARPRSR